MKYAKVFPEQQLDHHVVLHLYLLDYHVNFNIVLVVFVLLCIYHQ